MRAPLAGQIHISLEHGNHSIDIWCFCSFDDKSAPIHCFLRELNFE
eukprot:SAG31_NODE_6966_length_1832_cov_1.414310_3_plen_45_part_01